MRFIWPFVILASILGALSPFLLPHIPVATDLPKHMMVARVVADYSNPLYRYANHFTIEWEPRPTVLGALVLAGLAKVMDPFVAAKAYLALFVAALWASGRFLAVRAGQPPLAGLLLLPLAHTFCVFAGFLPYIGSIPFFALLLGLLLTEPAGPRRSIGAGVILLVLYGFHIVGLAAGCFAVVVFAVQRQERWRIAWGDMAAMLPSVALSGYFILFRRTPGAKWMYYNPIGQFKAYLGHNAWTLSRASGVLFLVLVALLSALVAWQVYRRPGKPRLLLLIVAMTVIGLCLPYQIGDWFVVGSRTFPFVVIACLAYLTISEAGSRRLALVVLIFLAVSGWLNTRIALNVQKYYRTFFSGMAAVDYGSRILPVIEDINLGGNMYIQPFAGIEDAYTIYRGGSNPYCFSSPWVKTGAVILRSKFGQDFAYRFSDRKHEYHGVSRSYDNVVLFGNLAEDRRAIAEEMCPAYNNGLLTVYRRCASPPAPALPVP